MIYDSKDTEISDLRSHLSSLCYKSAAVVRGQQRICNLCNSIGYMTSPQKPNIKQGKPLIHQERKNPRSCFPRSLQGCDTIRTVEHATSDEKYVNQPCIQDVRRSRHQNTFRSQTNRHNHKIQNMHQS